MKNIDQLTDDIDSLTLTMSKAIGKQQNLLVQELDRHLAGRVERIEIEEEYIDKKDSVNQDAPKADSLVTQQAGVISFDWFIRLLQDSTRNPASKPRTIRSKNQSFKPIIQLTAEDSVEMEKMKGADGIPTLRITKKEIRAKPIDSLTFEDLNAYFSEPYEKQRVLDKAVSQARNLKAQFSNTEARLATLKSNWNKFSVEKYKKYSQAFACIVMFLIGAPLGAIIKKGGLGVPVIVSIFFFILYYVLTITSEKWAKAGVTDPMLSVWVADFLLLPIGLFFLRQARADARLFDSDFYMVVLDKAKTALKRKKK